MSIKIEDEISRLGHLRNAAAAIVDYVREVSKGSEFQPHTEWTLTPDTWVSLHFPTRYTRRFAITLGVPLEQLPVGSMKANSRRPSWGRIYVSSAEDLPAAFQCLQYAYYHASNKHRKKNGFPEGPKIG